MDFQEPFDHLITLIENFFAPDLILGFNISEPSELMEMPSEGIAGMLGRLISSTHKASTFDHVMSSIESRSREIFIDGMDFELLERVNGGRAVLPYISNYVIEVSSLEIIDRVRRKPVFHVDVAGLAMLPVQMVNL